MATVGLYAQTLRSLRPRQALYRARRLVPPALLAATTRVGERPPLRSHALGLAVDPAPQSGPQTPPARTGVFSGYGAERPFPAPGFWRDRSAGLLFLFHLHGFRPLAAHAAGGPDLEGDRFWADVLESWLTTEGRPAHPAWHPYATSQRIIAWSAALAAVERWPPPVASAAADSLWRQAHYLRRAIEYDIGGNHVLKNAVALVYAGAAFESERLLEPGRRLLQRELALQLLSDGGHEERSTSYHREIAADIADCSVVLDRCGSGVPAWLSEAGTAMESWQRSVAGPDGRLPLLNDAWEGPPLALPARRDSVQVLAASGLVVLRDAQDQVVLDAGRLCPPHLPAHAHADALSFVMWADGRPLVADPGSYAYTGKWRSPMRATAAHSTVEVDGADQCTFWGDFRATHLPDVRLEGTAAEDRAAVAVASHNGYARLQSPVTHRRALVLVHGAGIAVVDVMVGSGRHRIRSAIRLAPGVEVAAGRAGPFRVNLLGSARAPAHEEGPYAPYLGTLESSPVLVDRREVAAGEVFGWSLLRPPWEVAAVSEERVAFSGPEGLLEVPLTPGGDRAADVRRRSREQWAHQPAGAYAAGPAALGTAESFARVEAERERSQPWMDETFDFGRFDGRRLLEVGVGLGTDHLKWVRGGAITTGIDLTPRNAELTRRRLELEGLPHDLRVMDAEALDFADATFDAAYSFGVLHHVPHPERAFEEIHRVLRPGGTFLGAVYNRRSFFVARMRLQRLVGLEFLRESWAERLGRVELGGETARPYVRLFDSAGLEKALREAGFTRVRVVRRHLGVVRLRRVLGAGLEESLGRRVGWYLAWEAS